MALGAAGISVESVSVSLDGGPVLRAANFTASPGSQVAVLGPSGCGKSTVLRILAGLTEASSGKVEGRGQQVTGPQEDFGVVFQSPTLMPWRSVIASVKCVHASS